MKVELKSFKFYESMSEETNCFEAKLYINGKLAGYCSNRGRGGSTDYDIQDPALRKEFESYASSLPPVTTEIPGHGPFTYKMNAESLIDSLVDEQIRKKSDQKIKRMAMNEKKKNDAKGYPVTVQVQSGESFIWFGCKSPDHINSLVEKVKEKHKLVTIDKVETV